MSTVHNPVNFIPEDYNVVGYLDNKPPTVDEFFGFFIAAPDAATVMLKEAKDRYQAEFGRVFGFRDNGFAKVPFNCVHCGQHIRYVVAAEHKPTGDVVAFGETCAHRIDLTLDQHRVHNLREVAARRNKTIALGGKYNRFMADNPDFAAKVTEYREANGRNEFVEDILAKLRQYGNLTDPQRDAVLTAMDRAIAFAARRREREAADAAERKALVAAGVELVEGRREIAGEVLTVKTQDGYYGPTVKMLVKDADGLKYWGTVPAAIDPERGDMVRFVGTVEKSDRDPLFGFFKRPAKAVIER